MLIIFSYFKDSIGITNKGLAAVAKYYFKKDSDIPTFTLTYAFENDALEHLGESISKILEKMK
jgi:hypothetical protein